MPHCGISQECEVSDTGVSLSWPSCQVGAKEMVWLPTKTIKLTVGAPPMEGDNGHSAALIKDERSSLLSTGDCTPGAAYSWTCVSVVKLWIGPNTCRTGFMYSSMAASMSQLLGVGPSVNREKVRWYVGAYRRERVVRLAIVSAVSGAKPCGLCSAFAEDVESKYDITACSSAKVDRNSLATYVASEEDEELGEGIELGG